MAISLLLFMGFTAPTLRRGWCSSFYLWINCYFFIEKNFNNNNKKIFIVLLSSPNHSSIGSSHFSHPLFDLIYRMGLGPSRVNFPTLIRLDIRTYIFVHKLNLLSKIRIGLLCLLIKYLIKTPGFCAFPLAWLSSDCFIQTINNIMELDPLMIWTKLSSEICYNICVF